MAQEHAAKEALLKAWLWPFRFKTLPQKVCGERETQKRKGGFGAGRNSAQLADLGPGRPRPCGQYLDPPRPRWRVVTRALPGPLRPERDKTGQR